MRRGRDSSLVILMLCGVAAPVRAQSRADIAAGVSLQSPADVNQPRTCQALALPCLTPQTFTGFGFALSAAVHPTDVVGVVGEVSAYPNGWASYAMNCDRAHSICALDQTNHVRAALGGLTLRTPLVTGWSTRGRFFAQALLGPQWSDVGPRQHVFQPGVGYDGYLRNGMAVRVEIDYRFASGEVRDLSTVRILAGLVVPLDSR